MMPIIIILILFITIGIYVYLDRKKLFNLSNYKTNKYKIRIWIDKHVKDYTSINKIDDALDILCLEVHKEYPGISYELLTRKLNILKIKLCQPLDKVLFQKAMTIKDISEIPKGCAYEIRDDEIYTLRNGVQCGNNIWIKLVDGKNIILNTALIHEIVHYILDYCGIDNKADEQHLNKKYWESEGWCKKVLDGIKHQ